jgi:uncharacterized repeat protein (TIGR04076 family)
MAKDIIEKYGQRVGYSKSQIDTFHKGGHRVRHVERLAEAAPQYSIEAEIVEAKNCNSGHQIGQKLILDMDGNFITKLCPKLISQLTIPVALINERLSEALDPGNFHFMRYVKCLDTGVDCLGFGEVMMKVRVIPRVKKEEGLSS